MSSLYSKITNLFDQDFYNFEDGKPILDFLFKHKEDIENFEKEYIDDIDSIRHQVCEEIRSKLFPNFTITETSRSCNLKDITLVVPIMFTMEQVDAVLDEIEKG